MSQRDRSYKSEVLAVYPKAVCVRGTWGGFNVWVRGSKPRLIGRGSTAREAWRSAMPPKRKTR